MQRLRGADEMLDGALDRGRLSGNLSDLERINVRLGGAQLSWRAVRSYLAADRQTRLLDVGTGGADIPRFLLRRARDHGLQLSVTATDIRPEIVAEARRRSKADGALAIELAEGTGLSAPDASFEIVHASLVLHHLDEPDALILLKELRRVASRAVVINDLDRRRIWWLGAWLLTRVTTRNAYTRNDAPLSVRRAYRVPEMRALLAEAGLSVRKVLRDRLGHRYALVCEPSVGDQ